MATQPAGLRNLRWGALVLLLAVAGVRAEDVPPSVGAVQPMFVDPVIEPTVREQRFPQRAVTLWIEALGRPDAETRRQGAEAFALATERILDKKQLTPGILPLKAAFEKDTDERVRVAAVRSLVALDAREAAAGLAAANRTGAASIVLLTDAKLATWKQAGMTDIWIERSTSGKTQRSLRDSAIRALAVSGDAKGVEAFAKVVTDRKEEGSLRLLAARSLRQVAGKTDEGLAAKVLAEKATIVDKLVAAGLCRNGSSDAAVAVLAKLLEDVEPAVVVAAGEGLLPQHPEKVIGVADQILKSDGPGMHLLLARALYTRALPGDVKPLVKLLGDGQPGTAELARDALAALGKREALRDVVHTELGTALEEARNMERGHAALAAGALKDSRVTGILPELLKDSDVRVRVAGIHAAWVSGDRAAVPILLARAKALNNPPMADKKRPLTLAMLNAYVEEVANLYQALGRFKEESAIELMEPRIAKASADAHIRASAIWSIGQVLQGKSDEKIAKKLSERARDNSEPPNSEALEVRKMSAIAIGMMGDKKFLKDMKGLRVDQKAEPDTRLAARWACMQLGEKDVPPEMENVPIGDYFMLPLDQ